MYMCEFDISVHLDVNLQILMFCPIRKGIGAHAYTAGITAAFKATGSTLHHLSPYTTTSQLGSSISHSASESFTQSLNPFFEMYCEREPTDR